MSTNCYIVMLTMFSFELRSENKKNKSEKNMAEIENVQKYKTNKLI